MDSYNSLLYKIEHAKPLTFSDIIERVVELYKKVWLKGVFMMLILVAFAVVISFVFSVIGLAPNNMFVVNEGVWGLSKLYMSGIVQSVPQTILTSALTLAFVSAFYKMCMQLDNNTPLVIDDYFYFLKKEYFSKLLMLGIIHTGIATVAQFMLFIPYIYVVVPLAYFAIIFANNPELSEMEIVKASFKLGNKKWLLSFGTLLVTGILGMHVVLVCCLQFLECICLRSLSIKML